MADLGGQPRDAKMTHQLISLHGVHHPLQKEKQISKDNRQIVKHPVSPILAELLHVLLKGIFNIRQNILKILWP